MFGFYNLVLYVDVTRCFLRLARSSQRSKCSSSWLTTIKPADGMKGEGHPRKRYKAAQRRSRGMSALGYALPLPERNSRIDWQPSTS